MRIIARENSDGDMENVKVSFIADEHVCVYARAYNL